MKFFGIDEGIHTEEYKDEEVRDHGEEEGVRYNIYAGVAVDSSVWEEVDKNQDEDRNMVAHNFFKNKTR